MPVSERAGREPGTWRRCFVLAGTELPVTGRRCGMISSKYQVAVQWCKPLSVANQDDVLVKGNVRDASVMCQVFKLYGGNK